MNSSARSYPKCQAAKQTWRHLAERSELADLIRDASGGLSDRDRTVLELAYRQGLDGPELADALGVTPKNANTLVERLRETIARSLGALLVCRRTTADPDRCPELAAILDRWDGEFTVLMRKRVARHIDGCSVCEEERARMVSPAALLGATPMVIPAPAWLRERTLDRAVVHVPDAESAPSGPEDDESWWPPRDFDGDGPAGSAGSAGGRSGSATRARRQRAGVGAALVVLGVGAAAVLAAPAAFRVAPANSPERLAPSTTTTVVTTTPSVAGRPAPSDTPTTLPPALLTTTTAVVAPTAETTYEPPPPSTPAPASAPEPPTTSKPVTTTSRPVTTRPRPTTEEPPEPEPVTTPPAPEPEPEPEPEPPPSSPTKPPTFTVTKVPPKQVEPECPPSQPNCQDGPIFN